METIKSIRTENFNKIILKGFYMIMRSWEVA